jgi:serine/threonine protein kinase
MADVWSAGIVLFAMLCGNFPFRADNVDELEGLILAGRYTLQDDLTPEAKSLVTRLLNPDPTQRPTVAAILADPWLRGVLPCSRH